MRPRSWARRLLLWLAPRDVREDFAAELDAACDEETRDHGELRRALWYAAQATRGALPMLKLRARRARATARDVRLQLPTLRSFRQDIEYALRQVRRSPGFFAGAVLTLGLGIGANLAVLTVAWQAVLKPLPFPHADRLVNLWETFSTGGRNPVMPANFRDWRREVGSLEFIAAYTFFRGTADVTGSGDPEQWEMRYVTADYFNVFGMAPLAGRTLSPDDDQRESGVAVISEGVWRRRFAADRGIIGREIRLAGRSATVVGVMPKEFETAGGRVDAWSLLTLPPERPGQRLAAHFLGVVGRLRAGASPEQANAELKQSAARAALLYPAENGKISALMESMHGTRGQTIRQTLAMLAISALIVLFVTCANLAGLQLTRGLDRRRELHIRAALGASRMRLLTQLMVEGLVLAFAGGATGVVLGRWVLAVVGAVAPTSVRVAADAGFDPAILGTAIALSGVAGVLLSALPAWRGARQATRWLAQRGTSTDAGGRMARQVLIVTQIALAVMLTAGATLLGLSLLNVSRVKPGFQSDRLAAFDLSLPPAQFETFVSRESIIRTIAASVAAVPGVTGTCAINELPFDGQNSASSMMYVPEGQEQPASAVPRNVTPGCLELLGVRLIAGRLFTDHETTRVAVVTQGFAARAWPNQDPIGRRVHLGIKTGDVIEIVGVIGDSRQWSLETRATPQFYEVASERSAFWPGKLLVRTGVPPGSLFPAIRQAVRRVDPDQPVARLRRIADLIAQSTDGRRFSAGLSASFAGLALVLTLVGTFALMAHVVSQRAREFGIRLALGATPRALVRGVMQRAWVLSVAGAILGVAGAALGGRFLQGLVFGVSETDYWLFAKVAAALTAAALLAAWIPARRAARVDPLITLRTE